MEFITHKTIISFLLIAFASLIAICMWYAITVILWLTYQSNGGKAPYLRYLKLKGLHLTKVNK